MWATPTASSGEPPKKTEGWTWTGLYWINDKGEKKQTRLKDQVAMWPTPRAAQQWQREHSQQGHRQEPKLGNSGGWTMWPTATARTTRAENARDTSQSRAQRDKQSARRRTPRWAKLAPEPAVGRVANGIPRRVDRLRGLGKAASRYANSQTIKAVHDIPPQGYADNNVNNEKEDDNAKLKRTCHIQNMERVALMNTAEAMQVGDSVICKNNQSTVV